MKILLPVEDSEYLKISISWLIVASKLYLFLKVELSSIVAIPLRCSYLAPEIHNFIAPTVVATFIGGNNLHLDSN